MSLLLIATMLPATASAREPAQSRRVDAKYKIDPKLAEELLKLRDANRAVMVFVELSRPSVADSIAAKIDAGEAVSEAQRAALRVPLRQQQAAVQRSIERVNGRIHATFTDVLNGFRATVPAGSLDAISKLVGVKGIHRVSEATRTNDNTARYVSAHKTWSQTGFTGQGVRVAIIDTGINYYHHTFAGTGEPENTNDNPNIIEPGSFPTAKVVAGYDFVGDAYNPSDDLTTNDDPTPDPDPKDCNGHGTHVAGTAAGFGVESDGSTYTGPYSPNALNNTDWNVPPGMAPRALLMAYKVFGCDGGTYVVLDAIERAVRDGADVINMSLGLDYGHNARIEAVASDNAVRAGVVVVASQGNSGPSSYIGGSPASGDGPIAVAALDAIAGFPSVWIDMPTGANIRAINANGDTDDLPLTGQLNHFEDNPATPDDESLGCLASDFVFNNFVAGQIAVTHRGVCARVDRAINGDAAGAQAVIMINNASTFPPFEGPIPGVDIPFLGVPNTDEGRFHTDDGGSATISEAPDLDNPGFGMNATFTSGGFRRFDQALKPDVIAPGVSVFSADTNNVEGGVGISGTSMASPATAGVAALVRQAWPNLNARQVKSQIVNTATPGNIDPTDLRLVGAGVVNALRATRSRVHITVPNPEDGNQQQFQASLAFGLEELVKTTSDPTLSSTRSFKLWNRSSRSITYNVTNQWATDDMGLNVQISPSTFTVPANGERVVEVTITMTNAEAAALSNASAFHGPVIDVDHFGQFMLPLEYIGGRLLVKPTVNRTGIMPLRVPWAVVPRGTSNIWGTLGSYTNANGDSNASLRLRNSGVHQGWADVFAWGLSDQQEGYDGMDIRAGGFQSLPAEFCTGEQDASDRCLIAAINNWSRFSNASENLWIVGIDTDNNPADPTPYEYDIYGLDAQLLLGAIPGIFISAVFSYAANDFTTLYFATAPPNSSTILLPFLASDIGMSSGGDSDFMYDALGFDFWDDDGDPGNPVFHFDLAQTGNYPGIGSQMAHYDAFDHALSQGHFESLNPGAVKSITVTVDRSDYDPEAGHKGWMIVTLDDVSGERQADLIPTGNVPAP